MNTSQENSTMQIITNAVISVPGFSNLSAKDKAKFIKATKYLALKLIKGVDESKLS